MAYTKTNWQNGVTPVNADNMNKIENELEALDQAGGGTHLYAHTFYIIDTNNVCDFTIYLLSSTPINTIGELISIIGENNGFYVPGKIDIGDLTYTIRSIFATSSTELSISYYGNSVAFNSYTFSEIISFEDKVVQL